MLLVIVNSRMKRELGFFFLKLNFKLIYFKYYWTAFLIVHTLNFHKNQHFPFITLNIQKHQLFIQYFIVDSFNLAY